jgi:hypothetical protein
MTKSHHKDTVPGTDADAGIDAATAADTDAGPATDAATAAASAPLVWRSRAES